MNNIQLPVTDPVLIFAIAMVIFLLAPMFMNFFKIPGIVGLILAGIVVGPNGLGLIDRDPTIVLLGTVGLLYIIFIAGLEIDLEGFKKYRNRSLVFGMLSFFIPFLLGIPLGLVMGYSLPASILLGSLLGSHTLLAYPIASRIGISKNKAITTAVGGTMLTDTFALLILAVIAGLKTGELNVMFWIQMFLSLALFTSLVLVGVPILAKSFFRNLTSYGSIDFVFVMAVLFVSAFLATVAGVEPIIGAFLAGLALNRLIIENGPLMNRIKFVGNTLFIPFFLLSVGMILDVTIFLQNPKALIVSSLIILFVIIGKALAAYITGKIYGYSKDEWRLIFGLTIPQAAATLAATLVGFNLGIFNEAIVNGVIIMILVTCLIGPYTVEKFSRRVAKKEEQEVYQHSQAPERILIPLSNPKTMESLLDLAFILKTKQSNEPLYPISIVQKNSGREIEEIAEAEKMLGHAVMYASGADIPIRLLTRVDHNPAKGIIRATTDTRISMIIGGWNGRLSTPQKIFGGVLDQVLNQTSVMLVVSRLCTPINTTNKIVVFLPPSSYKKASFNETIRLINKMATQLSVSILFIVINEDIYDYKKRIKKGRSSNFQFQLVKDWSELQSYYSYVHKDHLFILVSARRGTVSWHPHLEVLPRNLAKCENNFLVMYPEEQKEIDERGARGTSIPTTMFKKEYD